MRFLLKLDRHGFRHGFNIMQRYVKKLKETNIIGNKSVRAVFGDPKRPSWNRVHIFPAPTRMPLQIPVGVFLFQNVPTLCRQLGKDNVLLISIHCNTAGRGVRWLTARGWCAYTTRGNTRADALATSLYTAARAHLPGQRYGVARSGLVPGWFPLHSKAPAILQDCRGLFISINREFTLLQYYSLVPVLRVSLHIWCRKFF